MVILFWITITTWTHFRASEMSRYFTRVTMSIYFFECQKCQGVHTRNDVRLFLFRASKISGHFHPFPSKSLYLLGVRPAFNPDIWLFFPLFLRRSRFHFLGLHSGFNPIAPVVPQWFVFLLSLPSRSVLVYLYLRWTWNVVRFLRMSRQSWRVLREE